MKKVQLGRSRMAEEMARPSWGITAKEKATADHISQKSHDKNEGKVATIAAVVKEKEKLRVAAYARVSTDLDSQETSIENQREHYLHYINGHEDWELAGIYEESGVSGTKAESRPELMKLMKDCRAGEIDLVITKSISRFARNTSECIAMVRELTDIGVTLIFEKENIDTSKMESEFLLTLLAAFAESESQSISTNQKWSIRRRFQSGTYKGGKVPYGYRRDKKGYVIHSKEAEIVKRIFNMLCDGKGTVVIARELNADKVPTWTESYREEEGKGRWRSNSIIAIARNEFYTGDSLYQKTFMDEGYRKRVNTGQLDQYLNEADHPAIIDHEMFRKANEAIREHGEAYGRQEMRGTKRYVFSGKLRCGCCGGTMSRGKNLSQGKEEKPFYACENHKHKRSVAQGTCPMLPVFEQDVKNAFATALNRLAAEPSILANHNDEGAEREKLEAQLQSVKRRQSLLHDRALADRYTAELREKKAALDSEEKTILDALAKLEKKSPVADLQKAVRKRGVKETFETADEALFTAFVDHAVLWSKEKARFHFTCGLILEEDMRVQKIGRSYAPLPVRTEFDATQKGAYTWQ